MEGDSPCQLQEDAFAAWDAELGPFLQRGADLAEAWIECEMQQMQEQRRQNLSLESIDMARSRHTELRHCLRRMIARAKQMESVLKDWNEPDAEETQ